MEDSISKFFSNKAACLLHDPPNKACKIRIHREEAWRIAKEVLENSVFSKAIDLKDKGCIERIAKEADKLAASVERWLLGVLVGEDYDLFPTTRVTLRNIFNPKYYVDLGDKCRYDDKSEESFIKSLKELLRNVHDPRLAYHLLYVGYESLWIMNGLPTLPADTRVPTHTVFDHNYATASMMNWLISGSGEPDGILLFVDIGGVQRFISSSRKLIDLWASSYLVSALAWSIFWVFVKTLGPDVMIIPTCRGNPFYYHSLVAELKSKGVNDNTINRVKEISRKIAGYNPDDGFPRLAVIPPTATFMLPSLNKLKEFNEFSTIESIDDLKKFVENVYRRKWSEVYEAIINALRGLKDSSLPRNVADNIAELLELAKKYGFNEIPPLPIRVIAIETKSVKVSDKHLLYHEVFKKLEVEVKRAKLYRYRAEEELKLYDMTLKPIDTWPSKSRWGYEYCTVCGYLPAVFIAPSDENEYGKALGLELEPIFSVGERLCPYCLIKRLMVFEEILNVVIEKLLGKTRDEIEGIRFPSIATFATLLFKKSLVKVFKEFKYDGNLSSLLKKEIEEIYKKFAKAKGLEAEKPSSTVTFREPILVAEKQLIEELKGLKGDEELKGLLMGLLYLEAEDIFLKTYRFLEDGKEKTYSVRSDWLKLVRDIEKATGRRLRRLNTYYAIVKADGDNVGSIIRGVVEKGFKVSINDYLVNAIEEPARSCIKAILEGDVEKAVEIYISAPHWKNPETIARERDKIEERVRKVLNIINNIVRKENRIIVTPAYHSALSRALMVNALRDSKIVEEHDGMVIYAGGDDLLAVFPVDSSLRAVVELRRSYSFPEKPDGFYSLVHDESKVYGSYAPSLVDAGRSFCIYYAHYMSPLHVALRNVAEALEDYAKGAYWSSCYSKNVLFSKDSVVLIYSPRGGLSLSVLPLSKVHVNVGLADVLEFVEKLVSEIEDGRFSSSLTYDLLDNKTYVSTLTMNVVNHDILGKLLKRIFTRNCGKIAVDECRGNVDEWIKRLEKIMDVCYSLSSGGELALKSSIIEEFMNSIKIYGSALSGA